MDLKDIIVIIGVTLFCILILVTLLFIRRAIIKKENVFEFREIVINPEVKLDKKQFDQLMYMQGKKKNHLNNIELNTNNVTSTLDFLIPFLVTFTILMLFLLCFFIQKIYLN